MIDLVRILLMVLLNCCSWLKVWWLFLFLVGLREFVYKCMMFVLSVWNLVSFWLMLNFLVLCVMLCDLVLFLLGISGLWFFDFVVCLLGVWGCLRLVVIVRRILWVWLCVVVVFSVLGVRVFLVNFFYFWRMVFRFVIIKFVRVMLDICVVFILVVS